MQVFSSAEVALLKMGEKMSRTHPSPFSFQAAMNCVSVLDLSSCSPAVGNLVNNKIIPPSMHAPCPSFTQLSSRD